jgi:hypothetical protein
MIITTHNLKSQAKVEPQKLNQITTASIPNAVPQPAPVGDGFAKMITTHDEPKAEPGAPFQRDVDDMGKDKVEAPKFKVVIEEPKPGEPNLADAMGKAFDADAKAYADKKAKGDAPKMAVKAKPGRKPKKAAKV